MIARLLIVIALLAVTACITTTTGPTIQRNDAEAAAINLNLGINYLRKGNMEQARIKLERSIKFDSKSPTAHRLLGLVYEQLGDKKSAEEQYRIAVRQGPKDADALTQMAIFLCTQKGDREGALAYFDRALDIPLYQQRYLLFTNAGTCAKSLDLELAENYLRRGVELNPNYSEALLQLGDVTYQRGNYLQSRAFVERYLAAANPSSQALWLGYKLENALGDPDTANDYAKQLVRDFPESAETMLLLEQRRNAG